MDWLYVDDTPRAEQRAAYLSLDRALLDEVMGSEGADPETTEAIAEVLEARRGTVPNRRARDADELAVLIDRAGDVTMDEARARVADATRWTRGDPLDDLLVRERVVAIDVPTASDPSPRLILTETFARYAAAFGLDAGTLVRAGTDLAPRPAADVIAASLHTVGPCVNR
jgi:ATP-dependent Lhr-like helicase